MVVTLMQWHDSFHVSALQARTWWGFTKNKLREMTFPHFTGMWGMLRGVRWLDWLLCLQKMGKNIYSLPISLGVLKYICLSGGAEIHRLFGACQCSRAIWTWYKICSRATVPCWGLCFTGTSLFFQCVIILLKEVSFYSWISSHC